MNMSKIKVPKKKKKNCRVTMLYMLSVVNANNCGIKKVYFGKFEEKRIKWFLV